MASIQILNGKCRGCGVCIDACPFGAIRMEQKKAMISEICTLCGACVSSCAFDAIELLKEEASCTGGISSGRGVWVFGEQQAGVPAGVALELLGEGRKLAGTLGAPLAAVLLGENVEEAAKTLIAHGAEIVYRVDHPSLKHFNDESYADIFVQLIRRYRPEIVLIGATTYGRSLAPRSASRLDTGLTADCTGLEIDPARRIILQTRPAFGGNLMATIICPERRPQMCTVRPKVMKAIAADLSLKGEIIIPDVIIPENTAIRVTETVKTISETVNLAEADIVVSVGRGIGHPKNICIIEELADVLGGALGASRAVVQAGWVAQSRQVGQTGKTVSPKVYFACGISGAVQHLAGMSSSDVIIAINRDSTAPIFKVANFGIVGDVLKVVPAMTSEFKARLGR